MYPKKILFFIFSYLFFSFLTLPTEGATLKGTIYDLNLKKINNVLLEINTTPKQQYLAKEGKYSLEIPPGKYLLKANKGELSTEEEIKIAQEGEFIYDLFLLPSFTEEDELLSQLKEITLEEKQKKTLPSYLFALGFFLILCGRYLFFRKKYGKLKDFREKIAKEQRKTLTQHQEEIKEEGYLERTLKIIKKHGGRIYQKQLRREMFDLSEAKVSLILSELEHKGKIERFKKGRGKIIILKEEKNT